MFADTVQRGLRELDFNIVWSAHGSSKGQVCTHYGNLEGARKDKTKRHLRNIGGFANPRGLRRPLHHVWLDLDHDLALRIWGSGSICHLTAFAPLPWSTPSTWLVNSRQMLYIFFLETPQPITIGPTILGSTRKP